MKRLNAARGIFWLAVSFAAVFLVRAESGQRHATTFTQKHQAAAPLQIVDQNGQPAVSGAPSATSTIVDVQVGPGFSFAPDTVNISVGDTVRWTWAGDGHSVTSGQPCQADSQYCSPNDMSCFPGVTSNTGTVYTHTFSRPGQYSYYCLAHCFLGMTGRVNVSGGCAPAGWSAGPDLPSVGVRQVGVYFQANGKFYAMGGRSSDTAGSDFTHPFEYDPAANTWTTKSATYPDNQVNNMACGVLSVSGTPYIYCVGGSAAGLTTATARVFRYNPITDAIDTFTSADNWPGDTAGTILPGGFSVFNNKLYILGGFNINVGSTNEIWQFDPTAAVGSKWLQRVNAPVGIMYAPTATIGNIIYVAGASDFSGGLLIDTTNSFSFNPTANTIGSIAAIPRATGETRALNFNGKMLVMGGGRVAPNPSSEVDAYDPVANTWAVNTPVPAFGTARRNFPTDTDGTTRIWLAGGYAPTAPTASMEKFCAGGGTPTPTATAIATATATAIATATHTPTATPTATRTPTTTPTSSPPPSPTASPTPTPTCGGPAAWQPGPSQPPARYAFQAALGTDNMLYVAGGQTADTVPTLYNQVSRYNSTTNTWSNVAPLPVALGQGTIGAWNGKIYVAGGFIGGTSVTNALRIYDIATNTWTSGPNMPTSPGVEAAAGAVVNGKFYVMGGDDFNNGLNTNFIYDIATNTWTTGATLPDTRTNTYGTASNGLIYVYGGVILPAFTTTDTLLRYDPVANSWINLGSAGTGGLGNYGGISPFGTGQLLITDGANAMGASTTATHIFTISSGTFSAGPAMIGNRAGQAQGTLADGRVLVADGFNTASTTVSTVELLTTPPCPSATPTATATATRTPTATPTPTATATHTPTATPTGTPSITPRATPTPRARPTPAPRP